MSIGKRCVLAVVLLFVMTCAVGCACSSFDVSRSEAAVQQETSDNPFVGSWRFSSLVAKANQDKTDVAIEESFLKGATIEIKSDNTGSVVFLDGTYSLTWSNIDDGIDVKVDDNREVTNTAMTSLSGTYTIQSGALRVSLPEGAGRFGGYDLTWKRQRA